MNPKNHKEKLGEMFFEKYKVPLFYIGNSHMLSLLSSGRIEGVVLDAGDQVISVSSIY